MGVSGCGALMDTPQAPLPAVHFFSGAAIGGMCATAQLPRLQGALAGVDGLAQMAADFRGAESQGFPG
jgi:hypothetical protein